MWRSVGSLSTLFLVVGPTIPENVSRLVFYALPAGETFTGGRFKDFVLVHGVAKGIDIYLCGIYFIAIRAV
jgi:hypothetical protein